jgi:hypothetical protein
MSVETDERSAVFADVVALTQRQKTAMYLAFVEAGGCPLDLEGYSTSMVLAALELRDRLFGGLTERDAEWLRTCAAAIDEALHRSAVAPH